MKCCNCGNEMKSKNKYEGFWDYESDEMLYRKITIHNCPTCKIQYNEYHCNWIIPEKLLPSEKQSRTVMFIYNRLDLDPNKKEEGYTSHTYWEFINKYFEKAKKKKPKHDSWNDWDDDYISDCFGCEIWC